MTIAKNREEGGRLVRCAWVEWARSQPDPKPSWLTPWEELEEADKEADRCIWEAIALPYADALASIRGTIEEAQRVHGQLVKRIQRVERRV